MVGSSRSIWPSRRGDGVFVRPLSALCNSRPIQRDAVPAEREGGGWFAVGLSGAGADPRPRRAASPDPPEDRRANLKGESEGLAMCFWGTRALGGRDVADPACGCGRGDSGYSPRAKRSRCSAWPRAASCCVRLSSEGRRWMMASAWAAAGSGLAGTGSIQTALTVDDADFCMEGRSVRGEKLSTSRPGKSPLRLDTLGKRSCAEKLKGICHGMLMMGGGDERDGGECEASSSHSSRAL